MKKSLLFIIVFFLFFMAACKTINKEEVNQVSKHTVKEKLESISGTEKGQLKVKGPRKDLEEILLEKPAKIPKKEKILSHKKEEVIIEKDEEERREEAIDKKALILGEVPEEEGELLENVEEEGWDKEKDTEIENEAEEGFVFQPYYSAAIGSQGIFPDIDAATEEGWRISEMDNPSEYLGYIPRGWEVYALWYYSSPKDGKIFYTLNFYQ